jgi:hypothetical protein
LPDDGLREALVVGRDELTVRVSAPADDEVWVIVGPILVRLIPDSNGDLDELVPVIVGFLEGRGRLFVSGDIEELRVVGWRLVLESGGVFSGGETEGSSRPVPIVGPFSTFA